MLSSLDIINKLNGNKIKYEIEKHEAFYTVKDSINKRNIKKGVHTKNLFLKNKKGQFVLFSCSENENFKIKDFSKTIGFNNLSFASEIYLREILGIKPGSVSPFALLNDCKNVVNFYLEEKIYNSDFVNFHPLINTLTISIDTKKFISFMIENNKKIHIYSLKKNVLLKTYE